MTSAALNGIKEWIDEDLQTQSLDRLRKITNNQNSLECWIFQDDNHFYITDLSTRLNATIIPTKLSKLKSKLSTKHANEFQLVKISIKQYLYSVMLNFNRSLKKSEPYVFIFVQDFDVKAGETGQLMNKTDLLRLKIASHPTMGKKTDKYGPVIKSSNQTNSVPETILRPTSKGNIQIDTQQQQQPASKKDTIASTFQPSCNEPRIEREEDDSSNLSLLVRHLTPTCSGSYQDYTIDIIPQEPIKPSDMCTGQKADLKPAQITATASATTNKPPALPHTDLNHAFIKNTQSESMTVRDTMCTLDASECILLLNQSNKIDEPSGTTGKLSTQLNSLPVFECSSIHVTSTIHPEPVTTDAETEPKPKSTSSIQITKINRNEPEIEKNQDLIDSDRDDDDNDDSIEPTWEDKKSHEGVMVINDTQPCSTAAAEQGKNTRLMRRQSSVSNLSEINSILDGGELFGYGNFTSSTSVFPPYTSSSGRKKRKLLQKGNRASNQINNDDAPSENDDLWEKQSRSASKRLHKSGDGDLLNVDVARSFRSGRSLSSSSDSSSCSSSTVSFSTTSSISNSAITTSVDFASKSLLFAPKHYYAYKEKLYKKSFSEKKSSTNHQRASFKTVAAIFSPRTTHKKSSCDSGAKSAALVSCSSLDKHFESPTSTKLNSQALDKYISIENKANAKLAHGRRRLFDPKNANIEETFEGKKSDHVQLIGVDDAILPVDHAANTTTTTTTTTTSNPQEQSNSTTSSLNNNAEKSIPSGQNPNLINNALNKSPNSIISNESAKYSNLNISDNKTADISVVEQVEVQNPMMNFNFSLNVDEFQAFVVENQTLVESSSSS